MLMPLTPSQQEKELGLPSILRQAFRPMFLLASLFAFSSMILWSGWLSGYLILEPFGGMRFWHIHEMVFGFVGAVIVGFLLTAVQTWTGLRAINSGPLLGLICLWLTARLAPFLIDIDYYYWLIVCNAGFFLFAAVSMGLLVVRANNRRNLFFVPVLSLFALLSALTIIGFVFQNPSLFVNAQRAGILLVVNLMVIVSGRVIPMFTANGTGTTKAVPLIWLERMVLLCGWLIILAALTGLLNERTSMPAAFLMMIAGLANTVRLIRWFRLEIFRVPLVWSLHLAYAFIPLGFTLLALHFAGLNISFSTALHSLTAGAMGSLILAMMGRISLGHTGRPLSPPAAFNWIMFAIAIGAGLRVAYGLFTFMQSPLILVISALCWGTAFIIYAVSYFKILTQPRVDGRPG